MAGRSTEQEKHVTTGPYYRDERVTIHHADGDTTVRINQQEPSPHNKLFRTLGTFRFEIGKSGYVRISWEEALDLVVGHEVAARRLVALAGDEHAERVAEEIRRSGSVEHLVDDGDQDEPDDGEGLVTHVNSSRSVSTRR